MRDLPSTEKLRELFNYDQETGIVTWARRPSPYGAVKAGDRAGSVCINKRGLHARRITIGRAGFQEHRIIWAIMTGEWPPEAMDIDHKDRCPLNNRFSNLRLATRSQNKSNSRVLTSSRSGLKGVACEDDGRWSARICANGKRVRVGRFDTKEEAHAAYARKAKELFGEFARAA